LPNLILAAPSHALGSSMIEGAHFSLIVWWIPQKVIIIQGLDASVWGEGFTFNCCW
jgi:hypothetical protein